jgi:hypothetical protein
MSGHTQGTAETADALRTEIQRLILADDSTVLGVSPNAPPDAIRTAFQSLLARYDARLYATAPAEVRGLVADIIILVMRAHRNLSALARQAQQVEARTPTLPPLANAADGSIPERVTPEQSEPSSLELAAEPPQSQSAVQLLADLQKKADAARLQHHEGQRLLAEHRLPDALVALGEAVRREPGNREYRASLLCAQGLAAAQQGNSPVAQRHLEEAVRLAPTSQAGQRAKRELTELAKKGGLLRFLRK